MKKVFALTLCFLASSLAIATSGNVQPQIVQNCWDGSFFYRVATLSQNGDFYELGVGGSSLSEDTDVVDQQGIALSATLQSKIFMTFNSAECTQQDNEAVSCTTKVTGSDYKLNDKIFIERSVWNLSEQVTFISEVSASEVTANITKDGITVSIKGPLWDGEEPARALIDFSYTYCDLKGERGGTHFGTHVFPDELANYLR